MYRIVTGCATRCDGHIQVRAEHRAAKFTSRRHGSGGAGGAAPRKLSSLRNTRVSYSTSKYTADSYFKPAYGYPLQLPLQSLGGLSCCTLGKGTTSSGAGLGTGPARVFQSQAVTPITAHQQGSNRAPRGQQNGGLLLSLVLPEPQGRRAHTAHISGRCGVRPRRPA